MKSIYSKDSISRIPHTSIALFCEPYFKQLDICYFHHFRIYPDGSAFQLHHDLKFHYHFWRHSSSIIVPPTIAEKTADQSGFSFFKTYSGESYIESLKQETGYTDPMILHFIQDEHIDFFCFASKNDQKDHFINYLNSVNELNTMALDFLEKFAPLIKRAHQERERPRQIVNQGPSDLNLLELSVYFDTPAGTQRIILHPRELNTLQHVVNGLSATEIADLMHKSPRTIEKYLETLKLKFGCSKKSELVQIGLNHFYRTK